MGIDDALTAFNFDKHVHLIGTRFENLMREKKMTVAKALRRLEQDQPAARRETNQVGATILAMVEATKQLQGQQAS